MGDFFGLGWIGGSKLENGGGEGGGGGYKANSYSKPTHNLYSDVQGIGRRYANIVLKKADIPLSKRAGELTEEDTEKIITIMQNPRQYKVFLFICRLFHL